MIDPVEMEFKYWPANTTNKLARPPNVPTPCGACVKCEGCLKRNPKVGREVELSNKNWRTIELYYRAQATSGELPGMDETTRKNFGIIHRIFTSYNRSQLTLLTRLLPGMMRR
jgi:hypothetical protein